MPLDFYKRADFIIDLAFVVMFCVATHRLFVASRPSMVDLSSFLVHETQLFEYGTLRKVYYYTPSSDTSIRCDVSKSQGIR